MRIITEHLGRIKTLSFRNLLMGKYMCYTTIVNFINHFSRTFSDEGLSGDHVARIKGISGRGGDEEELV